MFQIGLAAYAETLTEMMMLAILARQTPSQEENSDGRLWLPEETEALLFSLTTGYEILFQKDLPRC